MTDSIPPKNKNHTLQQAITKGSQTTQWKTLATLGAATVLVTSQLAGCGDSNPVSKGRVGDASVETLVPSGEGEGKADVNLAAAGEGEGEGEGEGSVGLNVAGEGEGAATQGADFSTDDAAYLTQLGLIRGHLRVGYRLYSDNLPDLAETHMKHPRAEIYASLIPAFEKRGCPGFADGLVELTKAVTARQSAESLSDSYDKLLEEINQCEKIASANDAEVAAKVIENLLRSAAVEYQVGVINGEIDNLHEYQDAWGFTQVAQEWTQTSAFQASPQAEQMAAQAQDVIADLQPLWPSLQPHDSLDGEAARLFGAAARIQVLALSLDQS